MTVRRRWTLVELLSLKLLMISWALGASKIQTMPPDPKDGVTQEMMEMEEHNRKQGFAMGVTGEYFRYKHLFWKQPSEKDREEAIETARKIRCDVCEAVLLSLLEGVRNINEDNIADALEGNVEYEKTGDPVTDRMLEHKKGCNKHFKDELVAKGWTVRGCNEVDPARSGNEPCLYQDPKSKPNQQAIDSYETWKEVLFYACEQTVSRFSDSLSGYLADTLPGVALTDRTAIVRLGCEKHAKCSPGPGPSSAPAPPKAEEEAAASASSPKKAAKGKQTTATGKEKARAKAKAGVKPVVKSAPKGKPGRRAKTRQQEL